MARGSTIQVVSVGSILDSLLELTDRIQRGQTGQQDPLSTGKCTTCRSQIHLSNLTSLKLARLHLCRRAALVAASLGARFVCWIDASANGHSPGPGALRSWFVLLPDQRVWPGQFCPRNRRHQYEVCWHKYTLPCRLMFHWPDSIQSAKGVIVSEPTSSVAAISTCRFSLQEQPINSLSSAQIGSMRFQLVLRLKGSHRKSISGRLTEKAASGTTMLHERIDNVQAQDKRKR